MRWRVPKDRPSVCAWTSKLNLLVSSDQFPWPGPRLSITEREEKRSWQRQGTVHNRNISPATSGSCVPWGKCRLRDGLLVRAPCSELLAQHVEGHRPNLQCSKTKTATTKVDSHLFRSPPFSVDSGLCSPGWPQTFTMQLRMILTSLCGYLGECLAEQKSPPIVALLLPRVRCHCACPRYFSDGHSAQGVHAFSKKLTGFCSSVSWEDSQSRPQQSRALGGREMSPCLCRPYSF